MKLRIPLWLNALVLICCGVTVFTTVESRGQDKIRIGISSSSPGFLPTVIAEHKGFYSKYGLASEHVRIFFCYCYECFGLGRPKLCDHHGSRCISCCSRRAGQASYDDLRQISIFLNGAAWN